MLIITQKVLWVRWGRESGPKGSFDLPRQKQDYRGPGASKHFLGGPCGGRGRWSQV